MNDVDSDVLLDCLFATFERPELQFVHQWRTGDVVVWDEHRVVHRAPPTTDPTLANCIDAQPVGTDPCQRQPDSLSVALDPGDYFVRVQTADTCTTETTSYILRWGP